MKLTSSTARLLAAAAITCNAIPARRRAAADRIAVDS